MAKVQLEGILKLVDVQINPQVFRKISQQVANLPPALVRTSNALAKSDRNARSLNSTLTKTKSHLNQNQRAAQMFLQRMAQFAILLPTFATLNRAIQGSVKFLFEFDSALRDIVRIDIKGLAGQMEEVGDAAIKTAQDFGVSATEVLATTKIFKQAGFDIAESQEKAKAAILATQISTLSSTQAVELFIAAQKQFGDAGADAISVLDKIAKVEDEAAVNAADVADAFRTGGNALAFFTKDLDDAVGLIAALKEQTRKSGREVGTFFKTFATRVTAAGDARDAIEAFGIQVSNMDGSLRPGLAVINDLAVAFGKLTEEEQATAAKAIAGVRQFESLLGVLNSIERANELARKSSEAAGTADAKREITDAKLERQLGKLTAAGEAFAEALGDAGVQDSLASVLKLATSLLGIITRIVDGVGDMGGSLAPLLALGGVTLGRSIFGLGRGGGAGGQAGGASAPGSAGFIGPTKSTGFDVQMKRAGEIAKNTGSALKTLAVQVATETQISKARGVQFRTGTTALAAHTAAIKSNAIALKSSAVANFKQGKSALNGAGGLVALTIAASFLPKIFQSAEDGLKGMNNGIAEAAGGFVGMTGSGATLAAQFAFLGPQAMGVAFIFGTLTSVSTRLFSALEQNAQAAEDMAELQSTGTQTRRIGETLRGSREGGKEFGKQFLDDLKANVDGKDVGIDLARGIGAGLQAFKGSDIVKELGLGEGDITQAIFGNPANLRGLVKTQEDYLAKLAESRGTTQELADLLLTLEKNGFSVSQAFRELNLVLGAGAAIIDENTGMRRRDIGFEEFESSQNITGLAEDLRVLSIELDNARMGPDAFSDAIVKLNSELALTEREFGATGDALTQKLAKLRSSLDDIAEGFAVGLSPTGLSADEFFVQIQQATKDLDVKKLAEFQDFIEQLPKSQKKAATEILKILESQFKNEISIQQKRNDVADEIGRRRKALDEVGSQAASNAFAAMARFNAELKQFGDNASTDVLSAFQNVSLGDVDDVLSGTSGLSQDIQDVILTAFADPVAKAQAKLQAVSATTDAELSILQDSLARINEKLADASESNNQAALMVEKHNIELALETTIQKGAIDATNAKVQVLDAEREAADDAAEAEEKRIDLLEKLRDASVEFDKELRDIERSFEEFTQNQIADLLQEEADARSELKDTQQEVLDSTLNLSDAYGDLLEAQLEFAGAIAEAQIKSNLLARDISVLTGGITTFDGRLTALNNAFTTVLNDANISLSTRIDLERQLAEETLQFLQQAQQEITQAGLGVFGQTAGENQALSQGIAGLNFVAQQLGGSFEAFNQLGSADFSQISQELLSLPAEFRQQILSALSALPSTASVGGFSVEQLQQALGQVGAGVNAEEGLPSIEELNAQQVEQLTKMQELGLQSAQLQFEQVIAAREQVALAQEELETAKLLEQRANENLMAVRDQVVEQSVILDMANAERRDLLAQVIAADDKNTLAQIEKEAELFADQNSVFREVGDQIIRGIGSAIGARLNVIEAQANVNAATGHIPNYAAGNLSSGEAAGVLRAAMREKRAMPGGASLAVANTSEAIIPMHAGGIPNFAGGNTSPIAAGIEAIRGVNESVVTAIVRSVTEALSNVTSGDNASQDLLQSILGTLDKMSGELQDLSLSNSAIQSNTTGSDSGGTATTAGTAQDVNITLQTNQQSTVRVSGIENLVGDLRTAVRDAAIEQADSQLEPLMQELESIFQVLRERGLLSSFGQPG